MTETLPKILIAVCCVHERYSLTDRRQTDRPTDGRWHIANVNMSSRSLISSILQIYVRGARSRLSLRARRDHDPALPNWVRRKARSGHSYIGVNRSFSLSVTAEALRAKIYRKLAILLQRGQFDPKFQVYKGLSPPIIFAQIGKCLTTLSLTVSQKETLQQTFFKGSVILNRKRPFCFLCPLCGT